MLESNISIPRMLTAAYLLIVGLLASFWLAALTFPVPEPGYHTDTASFVLQQGVLGKIVVGFLVISAFYVLFMYLYEMTEPVSEPVPTDHKAEWRELRGLDQPVEFPDQAELAEAARQTRWFATWDSGQLVRLRWQHEASMPRGRSVPFCWVFDREAV